MNAITRIIIASTSIAMILESQAQGPGGPRPGGRKHTANEAQELQLVPANRTAPADSKVEITVEGDSRIIQSNNIPAHEVGRFPNPGNPNAISPQEVDLKLPLKPEANIKPIPARTAVGIFLNGVYMEAGTGEFWTGGSGTPWNYEALGGAINLGLDENYAHVQPTGKYHYHGMPTGYLEDVELNLDKHSPMVGWAFDGFPVYALYGYSDPTDPDSKVVEMTSSYRLKTGDRPASPEGPGGTYDGAFTADYEYVAGSGTLDECNGCFTKTPDFPEGTYAYFLTDKWPVIFRNYRGTPAVRQPRGQGGPNGPGGPGGRPTRPGPPGAPRGTRPPGPRPGPNSPRP